MATPPNTGVTVKVFQNPQPLNYQAPICDPNSGLPSSQFILFWQNLFNNTVITQTGVTGLDKTKADKTTKIISGTGLSGGGDLSADRTLAIKNTGVTAGTYTSANITVNAQGQLTAASSGSGSGSYFLKVPFDGTFGTVTFNDPALAGFDTLEIEVHGRCDTAALIQSVNIRINGDATAAHDLQRFFIQPTGQTIANNSGQASLTDLFFANGTSVTDAAQIASNSARIYNCKSTTQHKTIEGTSSSAENNGTNIFYVRGFGKFPSTSAVSSVSIFLPSGNFTAGYALIRGV